MCKNAPNYLNPLLSLLAQAGPGFPEEKYSLFLCYLHNPTLLEEYLAFVSVVLPLPIPSLFRSQSACIISFLVYGLKPILTPGTSRETMKHRRQ